MAYNFKLGQGAANLAEQLGGIGKDIYNSVAGKTDQTDEQEAQKKRQEEQREILKKQGFTDEDIELIYSLPPEQQSKAILQKSAQRTNVESSKVYQQIAQGMLGKGEGDVDKIDTSKLTPEDANRLINLKEKIAKTEQRDVEGRQKRAEKIAEEVNKEYKTAKVTGNAIKSMRNLTEHGDLSDPKLITILEKFGLDKAPFISPDSAVFQKMTNEFLPKAKEMFPGRVTDKDLIQFLKGVPSLTQTKEGRLKLLDILETMNEAGLARYKSLKEIKKEYGDKLPNLLSLEVNERSEDALDKISEKLNTLLGAQPQQAEQKEPVKFEKLEKGQTIADKEGQYAFSNGKWHVVKNGKLEPVEEVH